LEVYGPFSVLNAFRTIEMGGIHKVVLSFVPTKASIVNLILINLFPAVVLTTFFLLKFQEHLQIKTGNSTLHLYLKGVGVDPSVSLSLEGNTLDFGYCLSGERTEKTIQVNIFKTKFSIYLQMKFKKN